MASSTHVHALFPGTFDPLTLGHVDIVRRAAGQFDRVTVAVAQHPEKRELLTLEERLDILHRATSDLENVGVTHLQGLVVHGCREAGATLILRGIRSASDLDYELSMARTNKALDPGLETVLLASSPEHAHISSTLVRQVAEMGGDLTPFVPEAAIALLRARFADPR